MFQLERPGFTASIVCTWSGAMEDCASNFYIYLDLRQICAEHFEELPVQIRKEEILTIHDLRYVVVKELVKHFAEEFHPSFLVNPKIRPALAEPELIGSLFYDCLELNLKNREELINLSQLSAFCTIFPRFGTDVFGEVKYPQVFKVVKSALILAHGNADVERGFSESGKSVTKERIRLSESSINGIRSTSDGMKAFDNNPSAVPITKELLKLGRFAHSNYVKRLEEERKEKEKREQRAALLEKEKELEKQTKQRENLQKKGKDLEKKETEQQQEIEIGNKILEEANQKLKEALKNKDFKEAAVAQAMLESGRKKIDDANKLIMTTRERQKNILKRKDGLLKKLLTASSSPTKKRKI